MTEFEQAWAVALRDLDTVDGEEHDVDVAADAGFAGVGQPRVSGEPTTEKRSF